MAGKGSYWRYELLAVLLLMSGGSSELSGPWRGLPAAQATELPVHIQAARLGFTGDDDAPVAKFGQWTPLQVKLDVRAVVPEAAELVIEALDADGITTVQTVPLPLEQTEPGRTVTTAELGVWAYLRPIGETDVLLQVRTVEGGRPLSDPYRLRVGRLRDLLAYSVLFMGTTPPRFELPKPVGGDQAGSGGLRGGRILTATVRTVEELPGHWFGYESIDLIVVLAGADTEGFVRQLWSAEAAAAVRQRREALHEWVRRGGRLVVAGGSAADALASLPDLQELLPASIRGSRQVDLAVLHWNARASSQFGAFHGALGSKTGRFPVANLVRKSHPAARILIPPPERQRDPSLIPLAAQWPVGLGRVTLIAFDLHRPPFVEFPLRAEFWDWVLREAGANRASAGSEGKAKPADADLSEEEDELAVALRTHADAFEGIPVITFGWVAVLITLYLLLVGPAEYFLLKRLIGRQEWTWVTFPIIVLTVTVLAFTTAASLKGDRLCVNKLDVVDIDAATGRVYGTTWLALFSPRIDRYSLTVQSHPQWAEATDTVIGWWGAPRGPRAGLLPRQYRWLSWSASPLATVENVPIQVWSTKAFVALWSGRWPMGQPLLTTQLEHPPADPQAVIGSFTLQLPIPVLTDCVLFYAGQAYPVPGGIIQRGQPVRVVLDRGSRADQWLQRESRLEDLLLRAPLYRERLGPGRAAVAVAAAAATSPVASQAAAALEPLPLLGILFHEGSLSFTEGVFPRNASLRRLDQSWRLGPEHTSEIILVGRAVLPVGPAEEQLAGPFSPSMLWWHEPPASGLARTPLTGNGRQETWLRIYLPIASPSVAGQPEP